MRTTCPDCRQPEDRRRGVRLRFETFDFLKIWRGVGGRKIFKAECPTCDRRFEIDGGSVNDAFLEKGFDPVAKAREVKRKDLESQERQTLRRLRKLARCWPSSFWLFSGSGTLCVMRYKSDGACAMTKSGSVDQSYIVAEIDGIPNDGGGAFTWRREGGGQVCTELGVSKMRATAHAQSMGPLMTSRHRYNPSQPPVGEESETPNIGIVPDAPIGATAADAFRDAILKKTGLKPAELVCPREKSAMTPCVARDGGAACSDSGHCVGCEQPVAALLAREVAR